VKDGPRRTCIACRQVKPKSELVRLARGSDGLVMVDWRNVVTGRGAYACPTTACLDVALVVGRLARALKATVRPPRESAMEIAEYWRRR
jgi:uncharacterized protein